jgi:hypothetical protein
VEEAVEIDLNHRVTHKVILILKVEDAEEEEVRRDTTEEEEEDIREEEVCLVFKQKK